jgi:glycosyltransferase involved in cell wall biosynthesis
MLPLLTVAIPTHNRARYAIPTIRSILAIPRPDLEIVVSDTSTDGELATFMTDKQNIWTNDPRLIYFQPQEKLDMTGNHNSALARAKGEFICLIGDDDTIVEDALVAAAWAKENDIDLIAPGVVANYAPFPIPRRESVAGAMICACPMTSVSVRPDCTAAG